MRLNDSIEEEQNRVRRYWTAIREFTKKLYPHTVPDPPRYADIRDSQLVEYEKENKEIPLQAIVARNYVYRSLQDKIPSEISQVIADNLTTFFLRGNARKEWMDYIAKPGNSRLTFIEPRGGSSHEAWQVDILSKIINAILETTKLGIIITSEKYNEIAQKARERCTPNLTREEAMLLRRLIRQPCRSFKDIGRTMGKSLQWISKTVKALESMEIVRSQMTVNLYRIGFREYTLLVRAADNDQIQLIEDICKTFPFIVCINRCITGHWKLLVHLQIPDDKNNIRALGLLIDKVTNIGGTAELHETVSHGYNTSMRFYSIDDGVWDIPWDIMGIQLRKIHSESLAIVIPQSTEILSMTERELSTLELQIIQKIAEGITSVADLRKALRVGQERISRSYRMLKEERIIVDGYILSKIGLFEKVAVITKDEEMARAISAWSQTLPKIHQKLWIKHGLLMYMSLPRGGSQGVFEAIKGVTHTCFNSVTFTQFKKPLRIPIEYWDSEKQRWTMLEQEINEWASTT